MNDLHKYPAHDELSAIILDNAYDSIICYVPVLNEKNEIEDFKVSYLNKTALGFLGGSKKDHMGKSLSVLFPYSSKNNLFNDIKRTYETGVQCENVYYFDSYLGKGWSQNAIVKYDGVVIVYFRNVTDKKLLEVELQKRNRELQSIMNEIHHRVKNNLQIISSMLNLQQKAVRDPEFREAIEVCSQRIRTMAIIHHRIYEDKSFNVVNLKTFIVEILTSLKQIYYNPDKDIVVKYAVEDIELDVDSIVKVGLIINELLTNSFKHAFKDQNKGKIVVDAKKKGAEFVLRISDNGKGLPDDFSFGNSESVGMVTIRAFIEQMEGKVEIMKSAGTTFIITLPYKREEGSHLL
jgi:two-component sensor histidine kinase